MAVVVVVVVVVVVAVVVEGEREREREREREGERRFIDGIVSRADLERPDQLEYVSSSR